MKIKKLHSAAVVPTYGTEGAACFDLYAVQPEAEIRVVDTATVRTGLAFEVPQGFVMLVFSRSGHGFKNDVRLANCVGVVDSDYRGELMVKLTNDSPSDCLAVHPGDRIAQAMLMPVSQTYFEVVDELSSTDRGAGGFGSTGA